jgi:predicted ribosome quality control (RQC) complex YloA/Tae2 family protein
MENGEVCFPPETENTQESFFITHITEPFPQVYEFTLSGYRKRVFLLILPNGNGGFASAHRDEKMRGTGEAPSSEVMALRKYLRGARLSRFLEKRGAVAFTACAYKNNEADCTGEEEPENTEAPEDAVKKESISDREIYPEKSAEEKCVFCSFSRHGTVLLLSPDEGMQNGRQIWGQAGPPPPALENWPEYRPDGTLAGAPASVAPGCRCDEAHRLYFALCQKRLRQQAEGRVKKQLALIERVRLEQKEYARHEDIRLDGELLKSQLWLVRRGMKEILLDDYFAGVRAEAEGAVPENGAQDRPPQTGDTSPMPAIEEGGQTGCKRVVALDPVKTPQENAAGYFARAGKYRRGLSALEKRLGELEVALGKAQDDLASLNAISYPDFYLLLPSSGRLPGRPAHGPQKAAQGNLRQAQPRRALPYRVFEKEEIILWVGKDARANALISLKLAAGNDMWFHVKNYPGSHVILRRRRKSKVFTEREIQDAALLALYYSEARHHGREEVLYTEAKHVRAVPGAKPGTVHAAAARTITVTLDAGRLDEIRRNPAANA